MLKRLIAIAVLSTLSLSGFADDLNGINQEVLNTNESKIDNGQVFTETVQLIPKEEKERILRERIEFLKKDREKWYNYQQELLQVKADLEKRLEENNLMIDDLMEKTENIKKKMEESESNITENSNDIAIGQVLLEKDSEVVEFKLSNGKKIKLIKYTVFPGDSLSTILTRTFKKSEEVKYSKLEERMKIVISMNKNLKNKNIIHVGQVIYIPFFKN